MKGSVYKTIIWPAIIKRHSCQADVRIKMPDPFREAIKRGTQVILRKAQTV